MGIGASAERDAVRALCAAGYRIVERNFRCSIGELDVIARDGEILVFVEVRSRADSRHGDGAEMVTAQKRSRVTRVAEVYLQTRAPVYQECRFDVVAITGDGIEIIQDAWRT